MRLQCVSSEACEPAEGSSWQQANTAQAIHAISRAPRGYASDMGATGQANTAAKAQIVAMYVASMAYFIG